MNSPWRASGVRTQCDFQQKLALYDVATVTTVRSITESKGPRSPHGESVGSSDSGSFWDIRFRNRWGSSPSRQTDLMVGISAKGMCWYIYLAVWFSIKSFLNAFQFCANWSLFWCLSWLSTNQNIKSPKWKPIIRIHISCTCVAFSISNGFSVQSNI